MFSVTAVIEGLDEFLRDYQKEVVWFNEQLAKAALYSAQAGIESVREKHPYTDRTYQLTERAEALPERDGDEVVGAVMSWEKHYASYVNRRTRFNFTRQAERVAKDQLKGGVQVAVSVFCRNVEALSNAG